MEDKKEEKEGNEVKELGRKHYIFGSPSFSS